jgi:hypothetical protein
MHLPPRATKALVAAASNDFTVRKKLNSPLSTPIRAEPFSFILIHQTERRTDRPDNCFSPPRHRNSFAHVSLSLQHEPCHNHLHFTGIGKCHGARQHGGKNRI